MSASLRLPPRGMTIAEFLEWADAAEGRWQLRDGEPEMMNPPADTHGAIQAELTMLLGLHLRDSRRPCRVVIGPGVIPRLRSDRNMLVPDIAVTCAPPSAERAVPHPVLLAEILSPSNETQTRANIWAFSTIPSVAELLLVRSTSIGAELLRRQPDGTWPEQPVMLGAEDTLDLGSIGFSAPLRSLYRTTVHGGA